MDKSWPKDAGTGTLPQLVFIVPPPTTTGGQLWLKGAAFVFMQLLQCPNDEKLTTW